LVRAPGSPISGVNPTGRPGGTTRLDAATPIPLPSPTMLAVGSSAADISDRPFASRARAAVHGSLSGARVKLRPTPPIAAAAVTRRRAVAALAQLGNWLDTLRLCTSTRAAQARGVVVLVGVVPRSPPPMRDYEKCQPPIPAVPHWKILRVPVAATLQSRSPPGRRWNARRLSISRFL
jgi:hypothetical protein